MFASGEVSSLSIYNSNWRLKWGQAQYDYSSQHAEMKPAAVLHLCVSVCVCVCHSSHDTLILQQQWKAPEAPALSFSACRMLQAKFRFRFNHSVPQAILMKWDNMIGDRWRKWNSYQTANATQCVIGIINGVSQLVNAIVGFAVSIETNAHRWTVRKTNQGRTTVCVTNRVSHQ